MMVIGVIPPITLANTALGETIAALRRRDAANSRGSDRYHRGEIEQAIDLNMSEQATACLRSACVAGNLTMVVSDPQTGSRQAVPAEYFDRPNADIEFHRSLFGAYKLSEQAVADPLYELIGRYRGWPHGFIEPVFRAWLENPKIGPQAVPQMRPFVHVPPGDDGEMAERVLVSSGSGLEAGTQGTASDVRRGPFPDWDDPAWDHPLRLLDAVKRWSPELGRRLDEVFDRANGLAADDIRRVAEDRWRQRAPDPTMYPVDGTADDAAKTTTQSPSEPPYGVVPDAHQDNLARLFREWDRWDQPDRLVTATELAGRVIVERTRRGQPYILAYKPFRPDGSLCVDYVRVGEASHDALGPYDFDLDSSSIKNRCGTWLPARVLGGIEAESERRRVALANEEKARNNDRHKREMRERAASRRGRYLHRAGAWVLVVELTDWLTREGGAGGFGADLGVRACREFWNALQDGEFDRDGRTRVLLLNPTTTWARLTSARARWSLETHGWDTFVSQFLGSSWIEIELADRWLAGWVPRDLHQRWAATHVSAARTHSDAAGGVTSTETATPVADGASDLVTSGSRTNRAARAEEECERWLRALTERPKNRGAAFEAAKAACSEIGPLSMKAFDRVWPRAVPAAWREPGARKGSHKSPRS